MRLLLDQGLPRSTVRHLTDMGIAAEHVGDLGMATASDADVLEAGGHTAKEFSEAKGRKRWGES